jgi:hypothetical protein
MTAGSGSVFSTTHGKLGVGVLVGTVLQAVVGACVNRRDEGPPQLVWLLHRVSGYLTVAAAVATTTLSIRKFPTPHASSSALWFLAASLVLWAIFVVKSLRVSAKRMMTPEVTMGPPSNVKCWDGSQGIGSGKPKSASSRVPPHSRGDCSSFSDSNPLPVSHGQVEVGLSSPHCRSKAENSMKPAHVRSRSSGNAIPQRLTAESHAPRTTDNDNPPRRRTPQRKR